MSTIVSVDIGGTHIRAAAYADGSTEPAKYQRTHTHSAKDKVYDRILAAVQAVWLEKGSVEAIGVSSPGPLDPNSGTILSTPNIPELHDFPLGPKLREHFGVPVFVNNDANLAALGEWSYGAGQGHHHVLYLTISTGIGGGVITDDRLLQGYHGMGGELGHVYVAPEGPLCSCGYPGHLEAFASGPSIVRYVNEQLAGGVTSSIQPTPRMSAEEVAEAARKGDPLAREAYARAGEYLGIAVASFMHIFDPSIIILGGGVSQSGPLLLKPFEESLHKHVIHPRYFDNLTITKAALGDDAGLLGALALAHLSIKASPS
jgi:glucokinase